MTQEVTSLAIDNSSIKLNKTQLKELGDDEVRIQVLYTAISNNDVLLLEGKHKNDYFGTGVVGKVTAVGKNVGHCKKDEVVGVYHQNNNNGQFRTGFSTHLQVHQHEVIAIPTSIEPQQAASLLATGVVAYNSVYRIEEGSSVAIIGTGNLAYYVNQFAKKVFKLKTTIFGYEGGQQLAKEWGADNFVTLSKESIQKHEGKFPSTVLTEALKEDDAFQLLGISQRNGIVYYAVNMGFHPNVIVLDLVTSQKSFIGVKRGVYGQSVSTLKQAAYHGITCNVQSFESGDYSKAFEKAKTNTSTSIVLKY